MSEQYPGGFITKTPPTPDGTTAVGMWTLSQQAAYQNQGLWPGIIGPYVDDLFSTYLYTGNGSTQTITNNIDLAGEGGMVWTKSRSNAYNHALVDTVRGGSSTLVSNNTDAAASGNRITFNSSGYDILSTAGTLWNGNASTYASWTFRKTEKFFDVVTYTGTGSAQTINHNLGSTPGCIIVKKTNDADSWAVYHRSIGETKFLLLNLTSGAGTDSAYWNNTAPTSTHFTVGNDGNVNTTSKTYVAYLFAHNAGGFGLNEAENIISCGSVTADANGKFDVTLGYEPQWVLLKQTNGVADWYIEDVMRGMSYSTGGYLQPNTNQVEQAGVGGLWVPTATGFSQKYSGWIANAQYIYIAIRRPMKPPSAGTEVFGLQNNPTSSSAPAWVTSFPVDFSLVGRTSTWDGYASSRLSGQVYLQTNSTAAETSSSNMTFDYSNGFGTTAFSSSGFMGYMFKRAPGFFDVVCYTGTGSATTFNHNLTVAPEMMIVKRRTTAGGQWKVYAASLGNNKSVALEDVGAAATATNWWNATTPTSTVFSVGTSPDTNNNGSTLVAYLFATYPGVSKVGSYTGTGTTKQVNCGFTSGARFVLIKRTDSTGDWYVWDSARGIVAGNDPYLLLNSTAAEVTNTDYVDTYSAGFEISSTAPAAINANGGSFIFLAIA